MSNNKAYISFLLLMLIAFAQASAQRKCGTVEYMSQLGNTETQEKLENWIKNKQVENPLSGTQSFAVDNITVYQIPVVVHIIHNGESIGNGTNISDAQILSQIAVLNEDFRKLNADSINIPAEFKSLYSDIGFEFVMAKRDPNSQATNGIIRVKGSQTSWTMSADATLKAQSYWPSEDYFNIWVAPLGSGFLGWAQFPQSDQLSGLEPPYNATTDGIVITYDAFGSQVKDPTADLQSRFSLGRTTTHEVGHFFGLRHIWGDGGCGIDDYVNDTPIAESEYYNCPTLGASSTTCGTQDMFMNFMDYVDDTCMNIFSIGQKDRMVIIMENSPRRLSLTTSMGLVDPNCEDLAITSFITPQNGICNSQINPIIEIKNAGTCLISSANISLYVNGILQVNQDFPLNLSSNTSTQVTFNTISLSEFGSLSFEAKILLVNGSTDGITNNNALSIASLRVETVTGLEEDFATNNQQWTVRTNQEVSALNNEQSISSNINNRAAVFNYYQASEQSDAYISPKLNLGTTPKFLLFDYAYAYRDGFEDEFSVHLSTDCGNNFNTTLFALKGEALATAESVVAFYPSGAKDWAHVQIDLSNFANQEILFSFTGLAKGGNRILFDNIKVVDESYNDIALVGITTPGALCKEVSEMLILVENKGSIIQSDLTLLTELENSNASVSYAQLNLMPGERISLPLPVSNFTNAQTLTVVLSQPDDDNTNDSISQSIYPVRATTKIPLREKFETNSLDKDWILTGNTKADNIGWVMNNNRLELIANTSVAKGLKEIIALPLLDLSTLNSASMHFDFAYAYDGFNEELLTVKASNNCGESYETLFIEGGEILATNFSSTSWVPSGELDWKNIYVDLSSYAGNDNVQVIIELTSAKGNNAFVTNVELYASNIEDPLKLDNNSLTAYPNPSTGGVINLSFNLESTQPAKLVIYNAQGSFVYENYIEIALNQTVEIATSNLRNGMYFARLVGTKVDMSRSFIISH